MSVFIRNLIAIMLTALALGLAGCGGGGGASAGGGAINTAPPTLKAEVPSTQGKTGQQVSLAIRVDGSGTVTTAEFDIHFNSSVFESASVQSNSSSVALAGMPADTVCRYKWINAQTIRVAYVSASGTSAGRVMVNIPVKVMSENTPNATIQQAAINN